MLQLKSYLQHEACPSAYWAEGHAMYCSEARLESFRKFVYIHFPGIHFFFVLFIHCLQE
jgi:hypothetical protein